MANIDEWSVSAHEAWYRERERKRLSARLDALDAASSGEARDTERARVIGELTELAVKSGLARRDGEAQARAAARARFRQRLPFLAWLVAAALATLLVSVGLLWLSGTSPQHDTDTPEPPVQDATWAGCMRALVASGAASAAGQVSRASPIVAEKDLDKPLPGDGCELASVLVATRESRDHPAQADVVTQWRFPSGAERAAQASAQRAIDEWLKTEDKASPGKLALKTLGSFLVAMSIFALVVAVALLFNEALRRSGYEWDFSEFAKRALDREAARPQGSATSVALATLAAAPIVALAVVAVVLALAAMHRFEPPDLGRLATIITPVFDKEPHEPPVMKDPPKRNPKPETEPASGPRNYDEALDKINEQLKKQGNALVDTRESVIADSAAASSEFVSQKEATGDLARAFQAVQSSANAAARDAGQAASDWHQVATDSRHVAQGQIVRVDKDEAAIDKDEDAIDDHALRIAEQGELLCGSRQEVSRSGHLRVSAKGATYYLRDPVVSGSGSASAPAQFDPCVRLKVSGSAKATAHP